MCKNKIFKYIAVKLLLNMEKSNDLSNVEERRRLLKKYISLVALLTIKPDILIEALNERDLLNHLMNLDNLDNNANRHGDLDKVNIEELLRKIRGHHGDHL